MTETKPLVVLVDDDPGVLSALRRSLDREPYAIRTTSDPSEALGWVESLQVGAVVSDERMPAMTGTELLAEVSRKSPGTSRIMLTAYGGETARRTRMEDSVQCMIAKPWDDTMLRTALREFLIDRAERRPASGGDAWWPDFR